MSASTGTPCLKPKDWNSRAVALFWFPKNCSFTVCRRVCNDMLLVSMVRLASREMCSSRSDSTLIASLRPIVSVDRGCLRRLSLNLRNNVWLLASRNKICVVIWVFSSSWSISGTFSRSSETFRASIETATSGKSLSSALMRFANAGSKLAGRLSMQ